MTTTVGHHQPHTRQPQRWVVDDDDSAKFTPGCRRRYHTTTPQYHTTQWQWTHQSSRRATGRYSEAQDMSNDMSWAVGYVLFIYTIVLLTFYMFIGTYYYLYQRMMYEWRTMHERGPKHANDVPKDSKHVKWRVLGCICWVSFFISIFHFN